jgi:hypothetical protein
MVYVESEKMECPKEQKKSSRMLSGTLMAFLTRAILVIRKVPEIGGPIELDINI